MSLVESSENCQRDGVVVVYYFLDAKVVKSNNSKLRQALPFRQSGAHTCFDDEEEYRKFLPAAVKAVNSHTRVRHRAHFGKSQRFAPSREYSRTFLSLYARYT